jgi:DNA-binding GntR family transcriptional regulator
LTSARGRRYVSKSDLVAEELREMISEGELSSGVMLRQRDLAKLFGVSSTPVREALRRLESEGLINVDPHKGAKVTDSPIEALEENYRILAALESLAGRLAAEKVTNEEVEEIERLHAELAQVGASEPRRKELNRQFHFRLYECAHSPTLLLLMRLLWRSFPNGPQAGRPPQESYVQHQALIEALRQRDPDRVAAVIEDHVLGSIMHARRQTGIWPESADELGANSPRSQDGLDVTRRRHG